MGMSRDWDDAKMSQDDVVTTLPGHSKLKMTGAANGKIRRQW